MGDKEKLVLFGLLALIAWELYPAAPPASNCQPAASAMNIGPTTASPWIQQLAKLQTGQDFFTPQCGVYGRCG